MNPRKFLTAVVDKFLTIRKNASLDFETGATIKIRSPNGGTVSKTISLTELGTLDGLTASVEELNIMDGVTATAAELNRATDISARVVTTTATVLALTVTQHAERVVLVNSNSTVANTISLPVATGSGAKYTIINNVAQTQGSVVVAATGTLDTLNGVAYMVNSTVTNNAQAFYTSASSDKVTFNLTTTGGGTGGDRVEAIDSAANVYTVEVHSATNGTTATPFSET
jgi:hypothetical protein